MDELLFVFLRSQFSSQCNFGGKEEGVLKQSLQPLEKTVSNTMIIIRRAHK